MQTLDELRAWCEQQGYECHTVYWGLERPKEWTVYQPFGSIVSTGTDELEALVKAWQKQEDGK